MRCHWLFILSTLAAAPLANFATPLTPPWDDMRTKHAWNTVPPNWEALGQPHAGTTIDLHIALKHHHENALIEALYAVSDPRSPKYGAHLSKEQVAQLVAPHPDTLQLIHLWLEHHSVPSSSISTTQGGSGLTLTRVPVSKANEMLGASYQLYRRTGTNDTTGTIIRTIGYALPEVLHDHVRTVAPSTYFASTQTLRRTLRRHAVGDMASREFATALSSRNDDGEPITPSKLRALYKTVAYEPTEKEHNRLGVAGFLNDFPSRADLKKFLSQYRSDAEDATFRLEPINGGEDDSDPTRSQPTSEANLNIQYTQAIAWPTPHIFYSTGGRLMTIPEYDVPAEGDMWFAWLTYMIDDELDLPQTISFPYGDYEQVLPPEYTDVLCEMFGQLGSRGVTVLVSSGNDGVGLGSCEDEDGLKQFVPEFPSSCSWVTSVGGTTEEEPEIAASLSGGGFSNHFDRPKFQKDAVPAFLDRLKKGQYDGWYNKGGRGIPDISAQALKFTVLFKDEEFAVGGTSCAAPTAAGIISLLNDYRLYVGLRPFGFLNPYLYGIGLAGITDIEGGSNPGCGTLGFEAVTGWDPVTGLGTLDFLLQQEVIDSIDPDEQEENKRNILGKSEVDK